MTILRQNFGFGLILAVAIAKSAVAAAEAPNLGLPSRALPDGFGVNIHFTTPRSGEIEQLAAGGFTWVRMDFDWALIELKPGIYDFSDYDRLVASLAANHLRPYFILDYGNDLYDGGLSPQTDAGREAFCRWVTAAVTHFRDRGILWEMWNEPNQAFWKPAPAVADYIKLALAVGAAIRATAPQELYVGPATSEIDLRFLEACFKAGLLKYWDAVSVHPYRQTDPETVGAEYRRLREIIARYAPAGKTVPIVAGEWGYSSTWKGTDEQRQARNLARQWLINSVNDVPISIWYDWHDDGPDLNQPEHHFGSVRHPYRAGQDEVYEPKPAYVAARALVAQLRGFRFCRRLALESANDYALLFAKGDEIRLAAWTTSPTPHPVTIPASPGEFTVVDYLGIPRPATNAKASGLILTVSQAPLYAMASQPNDLLRVAAACPRLPLEFRVHAPSSFIIPFKLNNPLSRPLRISAGLNGVAGPITVAAGGEASTTITKTVSLHHDEVLHATWSIAGVGDFAEDSEIVVTDPLEVTVTAPIRRGRIAELPVHITNPTGEAFSGNIALSESENLLTLGSAPVSFVKGETYKTVGLPLMGLPNGRYRAGILLREGENNALKLTPQRFLPLDDFGRYTEDTLASSYGVVADGEPKVPSRQTLSVATNTADPTIFSGALAIDYQFDKGWKFLRVVPQREALKTLPGEPIALGLWIKSDGSGNLSRLRVIDSTGQTHQAMADSLTWTGWRFVTFPFDETASHWNGANDGQMHYPLLLDTLYLVDQAEPKRESQGTVLLAAPTLLYGR